MRRLLIFGLFLLAPAAWAQNSITVTWTAPSGSFTAYSLYRSTIHGGPYSPVASGITATTFNNTGLAAGTYYYVVTTFNGGIVTSIVGNGTTATVTCSAACTTPAGGTVIIRGNSVAAFNNTFTVVAQPTTTTFTFSSATSGTGTGGGSWLAGAESDNSNESGATVPIVRSVSLSPTSLTFPSTNVGSSAPTQSTTLTNTSTLGANVTMTSVTFGGTNPGDFSRTTTCTGVITTTCTATVTFTPTASGARSATILFTDNGTGSPQSVTLSGTGVTTVPIATLSPTSLNFGSQIVGTASVAKNIVITNTGTAPLVVTAIAFIGTGSTDYGQTNGCTTIAPTASCTIAVTFTPSTSGPRTANVQISDNAADSPQLPPVQGIGITTKCTLTGVTQLSGAATICQ